MIRLVPQTARTEPLGVTIYEDRWISGNLKGEGCFCVIGFAADQLLDADFKSLTVSEFPSRAVVRELSRTLDLPTTPLFNLIEVNDSVRPDSVRSLLVRDAFPDEEGYCLFKERIRNAARQAGLEVRFEATEDSE